MRRIVILLSVIAAMGAVTSRLAAQEPPRLERCSGPSEPIGELAGSGTVSFRILRNGHVDSATITVVRTEGISPAGVLSAARRWLPGCHYRAARQAGRAVAVTVEQPMRFPASGRSLTVVQEPGWRIAEEMPTVYDCHPSMFGLHHATVTLSFVIGADGRAEPGSVTAVAADVPTTPALLARIAGMCRYAPARQEGVAIEFLARQSFIFQ